MHDFPKAKTNMNTEKKRPDKLRKKIQASMDQTNPNDQFQETFQKQTNPQRDQFTCNRLKLYLATRSRDLVRPDQPR